MTPTASAYVAFALVAAEHGMSARVELACVPASRGDRHLNAVRRIAISNQRRERFYMGRSYDRRIPG